MSHISDKIICPKCSTQNLRKSIVGPHNSKYSNQIGKEYFCDKDHEYFGIEELVNIWNYDLGDFYANSSDMESTELTSPERNRVTLLVIDRYEKNNPRPVTKKLFTGGLSEMDYTVAEKLIATTWWNGDTVSVVDEPAFKSPSERLEAYEMVDRMFIGIPEWSMEDNSVDTGATHV